MLATTLPACCPQLTISKGSRLGDEACFGAFRKWGPSLQSLQLHRVALTGPPALPTLLSSCPHLRKLSLSELEWAQLDDRAMAAAILRLKVRAGSGGGVCGKETARWVATHRGASLSHSPVTPPPTHTHSTSPSFACSATT